MFFYFHSATSQFVILNEKQDVKIQILFTKDAFINARKNIENGHEDGYNIIIFNTLTELIRSNKLSEEKHLLATQVLSYFYSKQDELMQYYTLIDPILRQFPNVN